MFGSYQVNNSVDTDLIHTLEQQFAVFHVFYDMFLYSMLE